MKKTDSNTSKHQEKKIFYPHNITQCVSLLLISIILSSPLILLKDNISAVYLSTLIYISVFLIYISLTKLINKRRRINLHLNYKIKYNKTFLATTLTMIIFQIGIYIPILKLTSQISIPPNLTTNPLNPIILLIGAIILAPIFEEAIFRGIILRGLMQNNKPIRAIVISAVIYASINIFLIHVIGTFFIGLIQGYEYYKNRSLGNTAILNAISSTIALSAAFFFYTTQIDMNQLCTITLSATMLISSILLFMIIRQCPCINEDQD